ncbi:hypothetical protein [Methylorubrum sp. DB1722]|uniref:hypothetical protein n=1 Tax=Methylorubrum sp. DB1722 TaxID=2478916 RepID=UPI0018E298B3|nr:hypothetical protein [Methylorubrum sp. DB1722]MBI1689547.1 hypothetical protein [Methylorubrum sp. DB1722]
MTAHVLEASLGLISLFCAHTAIEQVDDLRAQSWLAQRLPAVMSREGRIIHAPGNPLAIDDPVLLFDTEFRPNPDWMGHPVIVAAQARREVCDRTAVVGYLRGELVVSYQAFETPPYSGVVVDWLRALPETDPRMLDKLPRVTWDQAVDHAVAWHEDLAARRVDRGAGSAGTVDCTPVPSMPGWAWVHLVTKAALDHEGSAMGHCVGDGGYDQHAWPGGARPDRWDVDAGIWSLRDPEGRSHVTVDLDFDGIRQAHGPGNDRPEPETAPAFEFLLARFVKPGFPFDVPYWLVREEDGATRMRTEEYARAVFRAIREECYAMLHGQVFFRPVGGGEFDAVAVCEPALPLVEIEWVEVSYTAPAVAPVPSRRARHAMQQPWFRQHERQLEGRRPR